MVARLSRQSTAPVAERAAPAAAERPQPASWAKRAQAEPNQAQEGQRDRIQQQIAPQQEPEVEQRTASPFSPRVQEQREALDNGGNLGGQTGSDKPTADPAPKRSRSRAAPQPTEPVLNLVGPEVRLGILQLAFANDETGMEDGMEIAAEFLKFVEGGE